MAAIAARILADAPPRFALAAFSLGGYIAFAMLRQAPERIAKLALLDTSARPDTVEQSEGREKFISMAQASKLGDVVEILIPRFLHRSRQNDGTLRKIVQDMATETGADAFVRQQRAIMSRFTTLARRNPLSNRGRCWRWRRADAAGAGKGNLRRCFGRTACCHSRMRPLVARREARRGERGARRMALHLKGARSND